jgi:precorrin-6B methylase 2
MTDYKATFEQWNDVEQWAKSGSHASTDHCILELLSRVESLEEDAYEENKCHHACVEALVRRIEKLENNFKTTPNLNIIRSSLVERATTALRIYDESNPAFITRSGEAKSVIQEVIKWLRENDLHISAAYLELEQEQGDHAS